MRIRDGQDCGVGRGQRISEDVGRDKDVKMPSE